MKVLVVDDHPLVRKGIISTLAFDQEIKAVTEASNVPEALEHLTRDQPDLTILDLYLGKEDGLGIVLNAKNRHMDSKFVVLTSSSREDDFKRAQEMNVDGYILKEAFTDDFMYAIKVIKRGKKFYDPTILNYCYQKNHSKTNELTDREMEVLRELGKGLSNFQIANKLYISENTVKKHVSTIFSKLGMNHRTEAALYANREFDLNA